MSGLARVLVTGSRSWSDVAAVESALVLAWDEALQAGFDGIVLVHGGCPSGADRLAWEWAARVDVPVEVSMADWSGPCAPGCRPGHRRVRRGGGEYCPMAGHRRNQLMVDAGAALVLAFPLGASRGTRDCMARAVAAGIPVRDLGAQR